MSTSTEFFEAERILSDLRLQVGDSEFGYRVQGLLAHVLIRLGGRILEIRAQGHPDITASFQPRTFLVQVKSFSSRNRKFEIQPGDLRGIEPRNESSTGYLALLDCALPVSWLLVDYHRLRRQARRSVSLVTLGALAERALSQDCTEEFARIVIEHRVSMPNLPYHVLVRRALNNDPL